MFDISLSELLVITVVGIVVLGPKEWPVVLRYLRGMMRSIRETRESIRAGLDEALGDEIRYIQGDDGAYYERYDLPDMAEPSQAPKQSHDPHDASR